MEEYNIGFGRPSPKEELLPFLIPKAGYDHIQSALERPNGYPMYQWLQNRRGTGFLEIYNTTYEIKNNTGFFLPKNIVHKYYPAKDTWKIDWIEFSGKNFDDIKTHLEIPDFGVYHDIDTDTIHCEIMEIVKLYRQKPPKKILMGSSIGYDILINIVLQIQSQSQIKLKITPVIDYINNNFEKPISLQDMADILHITPNHLCALFKSELKMRPIEYLNSVRINNAKHMLKEEEHLKIYEIAARCGFENDNYFREVFNRSCGLTPKKYRLL